jgi:transposase-like protein
MDPTTAGCPNGHCPARGQSGRGNLGLHARQEPRCGCHACHQTCSATTGTVLYRLRTAVATGGIVVTVLAYGRPLQALGTAWGGDERTGAAWWARSGRQGQAVPADLGEPPRDLGQVHAEELRVQTQGGIVWRALARMGTTRVGLGGAVSAQRALPLIRRRRERVQRGAARRPLWVCTDGWGSSSRARQATWRAPVQTGKGGRPRLRPWRHGCIAPVVQRAAPRRVGAPACRMGEGAPAGVETRRHRSQGAGGMHTAAMARLNATCRERLAPLARRCRARARPTLRLHEGMVGVGTVSTLCTPQASLSPVQQTTPAMAAGITDHGWPMHARLSCPGPLSRWGPPKRRGRPSRVLQHLIERWCA